MKENAHLLCTGDYDIMDIQLSISLLASDCPAALERCLNSLKPLMMQVPCELIVVMTGTDKKIREIASNYTEQIVPFTWCDDFSAARNAGLRLAHGEWFLYIDDDEWFEDTAEICNFFLSGEYRKYGEATYKQRNYLDWDGTVYSDFRALRMVRLVPESRFINPIHEELVPRYTPCKDLDVFVHHYGYIKNKKRVNTEKASRNLTLLLEDIRKRPSYTKNYVQIVQEYRQAHDWEKAEEYCRKGLKYCRKAELLPFRRWLQADLIELVYAKGDYPKAEEEILTILRQYKPCEMVRLVAYLTLNKIYIKLHRPEDALSYGVRYEETLAYMDRNPELWRQQECGYLSELKLKHPNALYKIRINCVEQALSCGNTEQAIFFLSLLPWGEETEIQGFYPIFDFLKDKYADLFGDILKAFPADSPYLLLQQAIHTADTETKERQALLERCMRDTQSYHLQYQVVKEAILSKAGLAEIVTVFELEHWKTCAAEIVNDLPDTELPKVWDALTSLKRQAGFHALLLEWGLRERRLIRGYLTGHEFIHALKKYIECILTYYREQYCEEMFQDEKSKFLPKECRFGMLLSDALQKLELMELPEAVRLLREALPLNPGMTGVIHELIRLIKNLHRNPAASTGEEFQELAAQMKDVLSSMLRKKEYIQALPVMQQLCSLLPDDLELLRMRQRLLLETDV